MSDLKERLADMSALSQSRTPADALKCIEEFEAENKRLRSMIADVIESTGDDPEIMAASRAEWAARALEAEAKLAKETEISNQRGNHIEFVLTPQMSDLQFQLKDVKAKLTKAIVFLSGLDRHGVYYTDELEDLLAELKGEK